MAALERAEPSKGRDCAKCLGSGKVTSDQHMIPLPTLQEQAKKNKRVRMAVEDGVLALMKCPSCLGEGKVPND